MRIAPMALLAAIFASTGSSVSAQQQANFKPVGDAKQIMQAVIIPSSNVVFRVEVEAPQDEKGWQAVFNSALLMAEGGNLLMLPGRAKDNGEWMKKSEALVDVGIKAMKAAEARDADAVVKIGYEIFDVCASCHDQYMPSRIIRRQQQR